MLLTGLLAVARGVETAWVHLRPTPFAGARGLSAAWAAPRQLDAPWSPSAGLTPPPPTASPAELRAWLREHYPVLTLELPLPADTPASPALQLGGGPPLSLYVEPGRGLVLREPTWP